MNHLERFRAVMEFEPFDRLPRIEWAGWWDQTISRWQTEGLPALQDAFEIRRYLGLDPYWQHWFAHRDSSCPAARHGQGIVQNADDYAAIRPHLYPPADEAVLRLEPWARRQHSGEAVVWITLEGFFWFPRTLLGIENHLYAFYDQGELLHQINHDLAEFHVRVLRGVAEVCRPAFMTFAEDMSYNLGPMLSRELFDQFLAPYYRQVVPLAKEMGMKVLVDTDGDCTELIPWLQQVGVDGVLPLERQAGVDASALRQAHPDLRMVGHFDKMVMNRGRKTVREEFERLLPAMRSGGFIPSVDHQTPPGVSLEQYRDYLRLLEEYSLRAAG
jgi:hypothetical protein